MRLQRPKSRAAAARAIALAALVFAAAAPSFTQREKKEKQEETQTLQLPKELPMTVVGETRRLTFHVTPLAAKGLLSQQVREALKALERQTGGAPILRIRAFVAGTGDPRRVRDLVSENFTNRHQPLPALILAQAGALPMAGAQVVLEAVAAAKKDVNPNGLAFFSPRPATSPDPLDPVPPLTARSLTGLGEALKAAGIARSDVLCVTCFLSSLDNLPASRALVNADYPRAAQNFVQAQRAPARAMAACEAVARLNRDPGSPLAFPAAVDPSPEPGESPVALIAAPRVVFTGSQVSFGFEEKDARLAMTRLRASLEQAGVSASDVAYAWYYPLSSRIAAQVRKVRLEFFDGAHPPAGSLLIFEGLPSMDAGFAVDVIAAKH